MNYNNEYKPEEYYLDPDKFVKEYLQHKYEMHLKEEAIELKNKVIASLLGCAIGDALGVPVEGELRGTYSIKGMTGDEIFPAGTWSDDTSLTLCLVEILIECKIRDGAETVLIQKFSDWVHYGYWTATGIAFGIGGTTQKAIERFDSGVPAEECGGDKESDNGNGSLMRISPLAWILEDDPEFESRVFQIERFARITHAHKRSVLGCIIYVEFLIHLYHGDCINVALEKTLEDVLEKLGHDDLYGKEFVYYQRVFDKSILTADVDSVKSGSYVVETLEAALWCLFNTSCFRDCLLKAVNLGGDTDTIGAITGASAGIIYGLESIPKEWLEVLARRDAIIEMGKKFSEI